MMREAMQTACEMQCGPQCKPDAVWYAKSMLYAFAQRVREQKNYRPTDRSANAARPHAGKAPAQTTPDPSRVQAAGRSVGDQHD